MNTKEKRLLRTYANARKSWEAWCFMNNLHTEINQSEIRKQIDNNDLLSHLRFLALKDMHIELYKLIKKSPNNESNLISMLEKRDENKTRERLIDYDELYLEIDSIIKARNKFYAHLDEDYSNYLNKFSGVEQYYKVFDWIEKSIISIGLESELIKTLKNIPSRDEFELCT